MIRLVSSDLHRSCPAFLALFCRSALPGARMPRKSHISSPTPMTWKNPETSKSKPRQLSLSPPKCRYGATASELEYGVRAWWTTELYLDGQTTAQDSTIFTGFRLENRFRPLMREHLINPVLYVEYENISGADKTILEVVGHDGQSDLAGPEWRCTQGASARSRTQADPLLESQSLEYLRELHLRKKSGHEPWEFGYALGAARPLAHPWQR